MSKNFRTATIKAMAACRAVGLTYYSGTGSNLIAVDPGTRTYHWVKITTRSGTPRAEHSCCGQRDGLTAAMRRLPQGREFTRAELASASWTCTAHGNPVEVRHSHTNHAVEEIWLEGRPA